MPPKRFKASRYDINPGHLQRCPPNTGPAVFSPFPLCIKGGLCSFWSIWLHPVVKYFYSKPYTSSCLNQVTEYVALHGHWTDAYFA